MIAVVQRFGAWRMEGEVASSIPRVEKKIGGWVNGLG